MEKIGIHRVTVDDGVEVAAHVYGQGPAIVFVHGALEDGEKLWLEMTSHLSDRYRCYLMDMRGTGISDDHPDLSPERQVRDLVAFAESVDGPVGVVGESGGAIWTLGAAARSAAIAAAALYEPVAFEIQTREQAEAFQEGAARMKELVEEGRLTEAAKVFLRGVYSDEEWATVPREYLVASGHYVPRQLNEFEQLAASQYSPTASEELVKIDIPLLLMAGTRGEISEWVEAGVRYIAQHAEDTRISTLEGLGHAAPSLQPEIVADELRQFFDQTLPRGEAPRPESRM